MELPRWLKEGEQANPPSYLSRRRKRSNFLGKTLNRVSELLEDSVFSEKYAKKQGLLQSLDARVKLVSLLALLITVTFLKHIPIIFVVYLFTLLLAYLSKIKLTFFIKRVWLFIPIFTGVIAIPAIFNLVTPGEPVFAIINHGFYIGPWAFHSLSITRPGILGSTLFVLRVATTVSLAVLLVLTTKWAELLKSLQVLKIPNIFILIVGMTYIYIFLLIRMVQDMHIARKSRTIRMMNTGKEQGWIASRIGYLFMKSLKISEDVYSAMLSRGYTGEVKTLNSFRILRKDYLWISFSALLCLTLLVSNYMII